MIKARVRKPIPWKKIIAPTLAAVAAIGVSVPVTIAIMKKHNQGTTTVQHTITYIDDYGKGSPVITTQKVTDGALAKMYVPEHRSNVGFKGWKLVKQDLSQKAEDAEYFDFMNVPIHKDVQLYSHYRKNLDTGEYEKDDDEGIFTVEDTDDGFIITGIYNSDHFKNKIFDVVVPDTITNKGVTKPVVGIGDLAFRDFDEAWEPQYHFNSISLPDTVKVFGYGSFGNNVNLRIMNMPKNLTTIQANAFQMCVKLSDIKFYDKLERIEAGAFSGNYEGSADSYIRSLEMPASLKFIGSDAFNKNAVQVLDLSKCNNLVLDSCAFQGAINLREITLPEGLSYIPNNCFNLCTRLRKITIPSTVKYIESGAFTCCYRLREIYFEANSQLLFIEGEYTFCTCYSLDKINFPAKLKSIGGDASFYGCYNLTEVTFDSNNAWFISGKGDPWYPQDHTPLENANKIIEACAGEDNFEVQSKNDEGIKYLTDDNKQCYAVGISDDELTTLKIPNTVKFNDVDYNVVGIGAKAFKGNNNITSVQFSEDSPLEYIYERAFEGCKNIASINLENCKNLTYIGDYAFYNALVNAPEEPTKGVNIDFSSSTELTHIGDYAFFNEESQSNEETGTIVSVELPNSLTYLGNGAFYNQKNITSFTFFNDDNESALQNIGNDQDSVLLYPIVNATNLTSINMSKCTQLTYLPRCAFQGVTSLNSIELPSQLQYIEEYAFEGCTNLPSITIPSQCGYIGSYAFAGCTSFNSITIPSKCVYIGSSAFEGCINLTSATFEDTSSTNWLVYKGSTFDDCDVSTKIGEMSLEASNAARLTTLFAEYNWLKND